MTAEHKRWYDFEPTVSLAVSLLRNAQTDTRTECADFIIDYAKSFGVQLPNDIFSKFDYVLKRWYDEDKQLSEAFEYLRVAPEEFQREISFKIIQFLEDKEIQKI